MKLNLYKFIVLFFITLVSLVKNSFAFDDRYIINYLSVNEGLSHNVINSILQDSVGFLWVASENGLNRFDGNNFKVYKPSQYDGEHISSDNANKLFLSSNGDLWVGANDGNLLCYDYELDIFKKVIIDSTDSFDSNIYDIIEDRTGRIWIATFGSGLYSFDPEKKDIEWFHEDNSALLTNEILSLTIDDNGYIWVGTEAKGIFQLDPFSGKLVKIELQNPNGGSYNNLSVLSLQCNKGKLYAGSYGSGVLTYNLDAKTVKEYSFATGYPVRYIKDLTIEGKFLYIGSRSDGFLRINLTDDTFSKLGLEKEKELSLNNPSVLSIYYDENDNIWLGTEGGGINKLTEKLFTFEKFPLSFTDEDLNVSVVYRNSLDQYWIGTYGNGTYLLDKNYNLIDHLTADKNTESICGNTIRSIAEDKNGSLWFGSDSDGLSYYDPKTKRFKSYKYVEGKNTISNDAIHSIFVENADTVWFGTWGGGVCRYTYSDNSFYAINVDDELIKNVVIDIHKTDDNTLWFASRGNGLIKYKKSTENLTYYKHAADNPETVSNNNVIRIVGDVDEDILWLGTSGGGLNKFSIKHNSFKSFGEKQGLNNDVIACLCDDNNSNIWISTINGLSVFLKKSEKFYNFDLSDGLVNVVYNPYACYKDKNQTIYMPGAGGIDCVKPSNLHTQATHVKPVVTAIFVDNKKVTPLQNIRGEVMLTKNPVIADTIIILPDQKTISLDVSPLSLRGKNTVFFRYKLDSEAEWNYKTGNELKIYYGSLTDGVYNLTIEAGTNNNQFTGNKKLVIVVKPPFYKSSWFLVVVVVFVILLITFSVKAQNSRLKKQNQLLETTVAERTEKIQTQNFELEKQSKEILKQREQILNKNKELALKNAELNQNRKNLENLVDERTKELLVALEKAKESDKLKTAFLTNISHEIRTPLNSIIGFSDLLTRFDDYNSEKRQVFIAAIVRNGDMLIRLIDDIIELSKFESKQIDLKRKIFKISLLLDKLYPSYFQTIKDSNKQIKLTLNVPNILTELTLFSDEYRVEQVLVNLLDNAIKYTEQGEVEFGYDVVECEEHGSEIKFFVKDTGIGIGKDDHETIFERFRKIDLSKEQTYRGTGLGLSLTKHIVEALGGRIWVESTLNQGSCFYFTLPIKSYTGIEGENLDLSDKVVLVAEDEEYNYNLIKESLAFTNAQFYNATDGVQAVKMAQELSPDLILMDIRMPKSDGYLATSEIRMFDEKVPIIAQTAYAMSSELSLMLSNGFTAVVTKPIDFVVLIAEIRKCLNLEED